MRRWKTFEAYLTARVRIRRRDCPLPSFSPLPPLPLPPLLPSAVLAHVDATRTRARTRTHTRDRGHAQLDSSHALVSHPRGDRAKVRERTDSSFSFPSHAMFQRLFLAANMADDAMRLATTALDGLSDADARRRDANLAAAPPPRRRRRSPSCSVRARDPAFVRTTRRWTPFRLLLPR